MNITIRQHGLSAVRRELHAMAARARDLTPAWEEWLTWWAEQNAAQFSSRGRRWHTPWKPLAPSTRAEKRREGWLSDPLVRTGDLRKSLAVRPLGIERIRADGVTAGTAEQVAYYHQTGTRYMPARKLISGRQVTHEGAASAAALTWIIHARPNIGGMESG